MVATRTSTTRGTSREKPITRLHSSYAPPGASESLLWSYCGPAVALAALAARAFARFATSAAFRAGDSFFFATAFFAAAFFCTAGFGFAVAAFFSAHRFFNAATMFALPDLLSFRFLGFGASGVAGAGGSDSPRILAHRSCWASFILLRAAAEN